MNDRDLRRSDRATRVQTFGLDNAADFTAGSKARGLFTELGGILADLVKARVGQVRTPITKQTLLDALFSDFKDIARTSRAIAIDEPGFPSAAYRFPADYTEATATTHAEALLTLLEGPEKAALCAKFIAFEISADFVEDLRADLQAIRDINNGKISDNLEGVENTAAIDTLLGQAQGIITRLDAIMQNKYGSNPDKLAAWKSASHVERAAKKTPPPAPAPPTP
jgi:hypothetical protein